MNEVGEGQEAVPDVSLEAARDRSAWSARPDSPAVLLVCDYSLTYMGGAQTAFLRQARALASQGWTVIVLAPHATRAGLCTEDVPGSAAQPGRIVVVEPRSHGTVPILGLPLLARRAVTTRQIAALISEHAVMGVVVHSELSLAASALHAAKAAGVPVLHTVHTFFWSAPRPADLLAPAIHLWHAALTGLPRADRVRGGSAANNALRSMTLRVALAADGVLSPSRHQAEALRAAGVDVVRTFSNVAEVPAPSVIQYDAEGGPSAPAPQAPAGGDGAPQSATAGEGSGSAASLRLLWAGRFAREKRLEVALEAVSLLAQRRGRDRVRLDVAGGTREPKAGVEFHGQVPAAAVGRLMGMADAVVITSLGFDNQPMVALEAFARGKPALVSDPVLAREFGDAAIAAAGPGAEGLAATLDACLADPALLKRAGAAALAYAEARRPPRHAAALLEAFAAASA